MKYLFCIIIFLRYGLTYSQQIDNTYKSDSSNIYNQAINEFLQQSRKEGWSKDTIFIEQDFKITDSILNFIEGVRVVKLSESDIRNAIKFKRNFVLHRIFPLKYGHNEFWVGITPFSMSYNRRQKKYESLFSGDFRVFYKFNGSGFVFDRIEHVGI